MRQDNDTLMDLTRQSIGGKLWRPIRSRVRDDNDNEISRLQSRVTPSQTTGLATQVVAGIPQQLLTISATESPSKQQDRTFSKVSVSFTRDANDKPYSHTRIWLKGYKGNTEPVMQAEGRNSPVTFLLETTNENIVVIGQPIGLSGSVAPLEQALSATVLLDGVISAPPDPTIAQTLTAIPQGVQFQFNFLSAQAADVVDGYYIYRNTVNDSASAGRFKYVKHTPINTGTYTFQDLTGTGTTYFYWVTAINTVGLESNRVAAGSGSGGSSSLFISRPSASALGTGGTLNLGSPANAYDTDETTSASGTDTTAASAPKATKWSGFTNASFVETSIDLKIKSAATKTGSGVVQNRVRYSLNNGAAWTNVFDLDSGRATTTDTISIAAATDMTQVLVEALAAYVSGTSSSATIQIYEIWAECRA